MYQYFRVLLKKPIKIKHIDTFIIMITIRKMFKSLCEMQCDKEIPCTLDNSS